MIPYQSSLGIEIREDALVLVHFRKTLGETRIQDSLIVPFSYPLSPEAEAEVVDSLKRFIRHIKVRPENTVVGIPRKSVILKFIEIPSLKKENIPQLLEYEIEKHLPFKPEEVYYDFEVIEKAGENLYRILLAAAKKEIIDSFKDLFERVPLRPKIFDLSSFGVFNALRFSNGFSEDKIDTIIFMGSKDIELNVVQGGLLRYSRILRDGESLMERLSKELEDAISGIDTKGKEKKIHKVILSGPGALRPGLIESIKERIAVDTKMEDLSGKFIMKPMEPRDRQYLIPAIGLALRGLRETELKINFLPHEPEVGIGKRGLYLTIILTCIVVFLGLASVVISVIKDNIEIKSTEKKIEALKSQADSIDKVQTEIRKIEDKKRLLDKIKDDDLSKLSTIAELTKVIPQDAWLVSLDYTETAEQKGPKEINGKTKREIIISGFATSASKLIPLMEDSPFFENVEFAGPITSGVEGKERFRIKALSKKAEFKAEVAKEEAPKRESPKKDSIKEETLEPIEPAENLRKLPPQRYKVR